ncbi:hypothetical protein ACFL4O_01150 [bacterium]
MKIKDTNFKPEIKDEAKRRQTAQSLILMMIRDNTISTLGIEEKMIPAFIKDMYGIIFANAVKEEKAELDNAIKGITEIENKNLPDVMFEALNAVVKAQYELQADLNEFGLPYNEVIAKDTLGKDVFGKDKTSSEMAGILHSTEYTEMAGSDKRVEILENQAAEFKNQVVQASLGVGALAGLAKLAGLAGDFTRINFAVVMDWLTKTAKFVTTGLNANQQTAETALKEVLAKVDSVDVEKLKFKIIDNDATAIGPTKVGDIWYVTKRDLSIMFLMNKITGEEGYFEELGTHERAEKPKVEELFKDKDIKKMKISEVMSLLEQGHYTALQAHADAMGDETAKLYMSVNRYLDAVSKKTPLISAYQIREFMDVLIANKITTEQLYD